MKIKIRLSSGQLQEIVTTKDEVIIGRSNRCDLVILEEALSRQHCMVEFKNGEFFVTDLNSANGVYIDSQRIEPGRPVAVKTYMQLSIGPLEGYLEDSSDDTPSPLAQTKTSHAPKTGDSVRKTALPNKEAKPGGFNRTATPSQPDSQANSHLKLSLVVFSAIVLFFISSLFKNGNWHWNLFNNSSNFLTQKEYQKHFTDKTCRPPHDNICFDLGLSPGEGEGVTFQAGRYLIYMYGGKRGNHQDFSRIIYRKDREAVAALVPLLKSSSYKKLTQKIHLVLLDDDNIPFRVYTFPVTDAPTVSFLLLKLKDEELEVQAQGDAEKFLEIFAPLYHSRDF
jgi:hypothetical protein